MSTTDKSTSKSVVIIGCFDTKGEDFGFLYSCLAQKGVTITTLNTGIYESQTEFEVDFDSASVARSGGSDISELRKSSNRGEALEIMGKGAARIIEVLALKNKIAGIIGMGGGGGTYMAITAMQTVPFGIPKLCLSTLATKDLSNTIGRKDIVLMPSVVDVNGLNTISRTLIRQAAGAICGMIDVGPSDRKENSGTIAISVFGNTNKCANRCVALLKARNYEVLSFHAVGSGGETMESLALEGHFDAILDLTTTELADELCGGICSAGPNRLEAAAKMGIPQVIVPGCLDMVNFGTPDSVPEKYAARHFFNWAPNVTLMRTNKSENEVLGKLLAQKVNRSTAPATIVLPLDGVSKISAPGGDFYRPEVDAVLFNAIKMNVKEAIEVIEVQTPINDDLFAAQVVASLLKLLEKNQ